MMKKSQNSMVTKYFTYLATDVFPVIVMESTFSWTPFEGYLLPKSTLNRYLLRHNISIAKHWASVVTILFLDFARFIEFTKFSKIDLGKIQMLPILISLSRGRYHVPNERNEVSANDLRIDLLLFCLNYLMWMPTKENCTLLYMPGCSREMRVSSMRWDRALIECTDVIAIDFCCCSD